MCYHFFGSHQPYLFFLVSIFAELLCPHYFPNLSCFHHVCPIVKLFHGALMRSNRSHSCFGGKNLDRHVFTFVQSSVKMVLSLGSVPNSFLANFFDKYDLRLSLSRIKCRLSCATPYLCCSDEPIDFHLL